MHLDNIHPGGAGADIRHQAFQIHRRFGIDKTQRHKLGKTAGVLLNIPQQGQMPGQVFRGFQMAEHHRGSGGNPQVMGGGNDLNPLVDADASGGNAVAQFLIQHFRRSSRQAANPGRLQFPQILRDGAAGAEGAVKHFLRRKAVNVHFRQFRFEGRAEFYVKIALHLRRQAGLDANLGSPVVPGFLGPAHDFIERQEVALLLAKVPAESAKAAALNADIGKVDVAVDHIGDQIAGGAAAQLVGRHPQGGKLQAADAEQGHPVGYGQILPGQGLIQNPGHRRLQLSQQPLQVGGVYRPFRPAGRRTNFFRHTAPSLL